MRGGISGGEERHTAAAGESRSAAGAAMIPQQPLTGRLYAYTAIGLAACKGTLVKGCLAGPARLLPPLFATLASSARRQEKNHNGMHALSARVRRCTHRRLTGSLP